MFWVWRIIVWIVTTVAAELLRPKPGNRQPAGQGDFHFPTAEEGRHVPLIYGTVLVDGPNVVWYGDITPYAIRKSSGWFSTATVGHRYHVGMELVTNQGPVDELMEIRFGDKVAAYTTSVVGDRIRLTFAEEDLFGGNDKEGGISGLMDFYVGNDTHVANDYLLGVQGAAALPGYRGVTRFVARGMYMGTSNYIKTIKPVLRLCPNGLGLTSNRHNIGGDANPACIIYDILCEPRNLGLPSSMIDVTGLRTIGNTLFTEGLGMSINFDQPQDAWEMVDEVLRHIDGVRFDHPVTGLITFKLARNDYTFATLPIFNNTNARRCRFTRNSWEATKNVVKVKYIDRAANFTPRVAQQQDLANITSSNGEQKVEPFDFKGFSNSTTANAVAARILRGLSYPIGHGDIELNREAWDLRPGSVFRLTWPAYGITDMVVRVTKIRGGTLDDGWIPVSFVEDIFSVTSTNYAPPGTSGWQPPSQIPLAVAAQAMIEAPHHFVVGEERRIITLATPAGREVGYEVWSDRAGGTAFARTAQVPSFNGRGLLQANYAIGTSSDDATGFTITTPSYMANVTSCSTEDWLLGRNLLLINGEIMAFRTVIDNGNGTYTIRNIRRAVLDTVPEAHALGSAVWFFSIPMGLADDQESYAADLTLAARLLPYTDRQTLALAGATTMNLTTTSRAQRPYPPGNVRVNGTLFPTTTSGNATLSWTHRDRTAQRAAQQMVGYTDASVVAATELTSYRIERLVNGVSIATVDTPSPNDTTYVYTIAQRTADNANLALPTTLRIWARRNALESAIQERTWTMNP